MAVDHTQGEDTQSDGLGGGDGDQEECIVVSPEELDGGSSFGTTREKEVRLCLNLKGSLTSRLEE